MKIKLATILLIFIPVAVFFAGVSNQHAKPPIANVHVGMTKNQFSTIMKSISAVEVSRPDSYNRVQTNGSPEDSTYWKLAGTPLLIESVTILGSELVTGLYLDMTSSKKLEIHGTGAKTKILTFHRLLKEELEVGNENRPLWGRGFGN